VKILGLFRRNRISSRFQTTFTVRQSSAIVPPATRTGATPSRGVHAWILLVDHGRPCLILRIEGAAIERLVPYDYPSTVRGVGYGPATGQQGKLAVR
jgi:hypothetical protein